MYTLYYAPGAASLLVHWLLIELEQPHELRAVDLKGREQKQVAYLALNPCGVVPTLIDSGVARVEASALAMSLADRHPEAGLAPALDDPRRADYNQWMFHLANAVQPLFRLWWYPGEAAGEANADAALEAVRPRIEAAWTRIDPHLEANGPWLLGAAGPSAADFYLTMLMRWSRGMPRPATDWPHLADLARRMKARPSFRLLYEREGLTDWA
ncbi:MAG: glutathione S-transferase family protein [Pseudomonadota bacterium]|nr:glutathione S-transferase family protein [Pseudomonadota bacterium]